MSSVKLEFLGKRSKIASEYKSPSDAYVTIGLFFFGVYLFLLTF